MDFERAKILFFDTETTGLVNHKLPGSDPCQPHLVQLGAILTIGREQIHKVSITVNNGVPIPERASQVHGITEEKASMIGMSPVAGCSIFYNMAKLADVFVMHNASFDMRVLQAAFCRVDRCYDFWQVPTVCTMKDLTPILKIPGRFGYKWPTLMEAYKALVDENGFEDAHDALADISATYDVFWAGVDKNISWNTQSQASF